MVVSYTELSHLFEAFGSKSSEFQVFFVSIGKVNISMFFLNLLSFTFRYFILLKTDFYSS